MYNSHYFNDILERFAFVDVELMDGILVMFKFCVVCGAFRHVAGSPVLEDFTLVTSVSGKRMELMGGTEWHCKSEKYDEEERRWW